MPVNITRHDIAWSYVGYVLTYSINVLMLPVVLRVLSPSELGLWYTFLAINQFVMLLDFGFMPTVLRNASFCWSGANALAREGIAQDASMQDKGPNYALLAIVMKASRRIYGIIGLIALGLLMSVGFFYIRTVARDLPVMQVNLAWVVFTVGVVINIACGYWPALLRGIGAVAESNRVLVVSRGVQLAVTLVGLWLQGKLLAVAIGFVACGITARVVALRSFWSYEGLRSHLSAHAHALDRVAVIQTTAIIWHNARRQGLASIGNGLIQRSGMLICSSLLGLSVAASYGLVQQLFSMVTACAAILFNTYLPVMNGAGLRRDIEPARTCFSRGMAVGWMVMLGGTLGIVFAAPLLLNVVGSKTQMITPLQSTFMGLILTLELTHLLSYAFLTTQNQIPAPFAFLATGVAIVSLSLVLVHFTALGLWGIFIAYGVAQVAFNNWRWPQLALRACEMGPLEFLRLAILQVARMRRFFFTTIVKTP